jgi:hypothetical protein
MLRLKRKGLMR